MEPLNKRFVKRKILLQAFWPRSTLSRYLSWTTIVLGTDIWIFMSECVLLKFLDPIFILFVRSPLCELGPWRFKMRSGNFLFFHSKGNSCLKKKIMIIIIKKTTRKRTNRRKHKLINRWLNGRTNERTSERNKERANKRMNKQASERANARNERTNTWINQSISQSL